VLYALQHAKMLLEEGLGVCTFLNGSITIMAKELREASSEEAGMTYKDVGYQTDFDPDERRDR